MFTRWKKQKCGGVFFERRRLFVDDEQIEESAVRLKLEEYMKKREEILKNSIAMRQDQNIIEDELA